MYHWRHECISAVDMSKSNKQRCNFLHICEHQLLRYLWDVITSDLLFFASGGRDVMSCTSMEVGASRLNERVLAGSLKLPGGNTSPPLWRRRRFDSYMCEWWHELWLCLWQTMYASWLHRIIERLYARRWAPLDVRMRLRATYDCALSKISLPMSIIAASTDIPWPLIV